AGKPPIVLTLAGCALCNDAVLEAVSGEPGTFSTVGDPTEGALVIASAEAGTMESRSGKGFSPRCRTAVRFRPQADDDRSSPQP
ncbi:MAG: hypothetical protein MZU97_06265, partial [Bacillus subtilis]|nr:hypothetical protein [Bacillus subtilis]